MRILHIMDKVSVDGSKIHGPARQIAYRVPYYDPERYSVVFCNLRGEEPGCEVLRRTGVEVISLGRGKFDLRALSDILRIIRETRPSALHLHGYASSTFGRLAGLISRAPVVVQEHGVATNVPVYQRVADYCLRRFQHRSLAVSEAVKSFMVEKRGFPQSRIEVIGNGVPVEKIKRVARKRILKLKNELGIEQDFKVVGVLGRLAEMKGQKYFLQAAARLLARRQDIKFVIVGEGPTGASLRRQAKELAISENVVFAGYRENIDDFLSMFDVSVVSSVPGDGLFVEGFCAVGIESFAVGTPLVMTDMPCFRGIYENNSNVRMVPAKDPDAMADAIENIITDPTEAARLVKNGRETLKRYNMRHIASLYMELYESLKEQTSSEKLAGS